MKLGFLTGRLADIEKAKQFNFQAVELFVAALGDPREGPIDKAKISETRALLEKTGIEISALAYYRFACRDDEIDSLHSELAHVFDAAEALNIRTVGAMSGFDSDRDWEKNVQFFADKFGPVAEDAERRGLRVAFENWMSVCHGPVPFKPVNMGGSPDTWDAWFSAVPSKALGIEFDPSHLYWQGIDHMRALREYKDRIYHIHAKDTEILHERRYRGGINGGFFRFRIPGYGEIDWTDFISGLAEIGYDGGVAIEHEDPVYSGERFDEGLVRGWQVLNPLISPSIP